MPVNVRSIGMHAQLQNGKSEFDFFLHWNRDILLRCLVRYYSYNSSTSKKKLYNTSIC